MKRKVAGRVPLFLLDEALSLLSDCIDSAGDEARDSLAPAQ